MITRLKQKIAVLNNYAIYKKYSLLANTSHNDIPLDKNSSFVISVASYPGRIQFIPAVFESLARQTVLPRHAYLVLAEEEWPNRRVPNYISYMNERGIEIVWTKNNPYAVKMLVPIIEKHPDLGVITFGDDMIYTPNIIKDAVYANRLNCNCIVGQIGRKLYRKGNKLGMMFREQGIADPQTPSSQVYLMGCGTYYPPKSLHEKVTDLNAITKIVPGRGSDIWFWAAAVAAGTEQVCLGKKADKGLWIPIPQSKKSRPRDMPGMLILEKRFQMTIDFFGIREHLINALPDMKI